MALIRQCNRCDAVDPEMTDVDGLDNPPLPTGWRRASLPWEVKLEFPEGAERGEVSGSTWGSSDLCDDCVVELHEWYELPGHVGFDEFRKERQA